MSSFANIDIILTGSSQICFFKEWANDQNVDILVFIMHSDKAGSNPLHGYETGRTWLLKNLSIVNTERITKMCVYVVFLKPLNRHETMSVVMVYIHLRQFRPLLQPRSP